MRLPTRTLEPIHANAKDPKFETMPNSPLYDNLDFANLQISAFNGDPLNLESFTDSDLKFVFRYKDVSGMTPFHYAWYNGHYKTAFEIYKHCKLKNISLFSTNYDILPAAFFAVIYLANLSGIIEKYFTKKERERIDFCNIGF